MLDSGIHGGLDILRALALGAKAAFAGRAFLYGLGALGEAGARHVVDLFLDELRTEFQHVGARSVAETATITVRHPGAWHFVENRVVVTGVPVENSYVRETTGSSAMLPREG